jgi:dimethylglycine dehydrogenase
MSEELNKVDFPSKVRVVVIGGGVVGASVLYHLAKRGWTDCLLLEKNELTSGSTWHAAGNIPTFSSSWAVMNMQRYSTELYRRLGDEVDYPMNYHITGALRLGHTKERAQEFETVASMGRRQGMDIQIMTPEEAQKLNPLMETHDLESVLWDEFDGDIDPAQLTQALAKGARDMGAKIIRFCPVTGARREGDKKTGEWIIETEKGEVRCDYVVNAAGYRAREVGEMFGRVVPMMTMSHQYILFQDHPKIKEFTESNGDRMPMIRDVDTSYYLRQEKNGLNLGPYERGCKAHWVTEEDPMPEDFSFQLWNDDLERLEPYLEDAMQRVPVMAESGLENVINGPIPYTPDGNPLIGPMPGVPNAFEACVFTFGICQAGGAGKVMAEWIIDGTTEWDMWAVDPRRFTAYASELDYCVAKGMEVYGHEYAMHFPHHVWPAGRNSIKSPIHDRLVEMGAQLGPYNGWERANYFAKAGDDTSEEATQTWQRKGPWHQRIKEECEMVSTDCGVLAISGFSRLNLEGKGARMWLNKQTASRLPKVGRVGLGYFCDEKGRTLTEMSVIPKSKDQIWLITAALAQWHDRDLLEKNLPDHLTVTDRTSDFECFLVTGPKSRDLLSQIVEGADLSEAWLSQQAAKVCGHNVTLIRVSYAGELGWEIHCPIGHALEIYETVLDAGAKPFGMWALESMRLEKGYRSWKGDLSTDYTLLECGLERFVRLDKKADFTGKAALNAQAEKGVTKRFATLIVDCDEYDPPYMSSVWAGDKIVGEVTSGGYGHRSENCIAFVMLDIEHHALGIELEVEIYGNRYKATVQEDRAIWDPMNERLRA